MCDLLFNIMTLLVIFQVKHFVADYILQSAFPICLDKFKEGWIGVRGCSIHCAMHAVMTGMVLMPFKLVYTNLLWQKIMILVVVDFLAHFGLDWLKAQPRFFGRYEVLSKKDFQELANIDNTSFRLWFEKQRKLASNTNFWITLGADQMGHHLTHYYIIYQVVKVVYLG